MKIKKENKLKFTITNFSEALNLTPEERIIESEKLYSEIEIINPKPWKPFWKSFKSFEEFEAWKKKQKDPRFW